MAATTEIKEFLRSLRFKADCRHMWIVVDKEALERVLTKYFSFPCQFYFHHQSLSLIILRLTLLTASLNN